MTTVCWCRRLVMTRDCSLSGIQVSTINCFVSSEICCCIFFKVMTVRPHLKQTNTQIQLCMTHLCSCLRKSDLVTSNSVPIILALPRILLSYFSINLLNLVRSILVAVLCLPALHFRWTVIAFRAHTHTHPHTTSNHADLQLLPPSVHKSKNRCCLPVN